MKNSYYP